MTITSKIWGSDQNRTELDAVWGFVYKHNLGQNPTGFPSQASRLLSRFSFVHVRMIVVVRWFLIAFFYFFGPTHLARVDRLQVFEFLLSPFSYFFGPTHFLRLSMLGQIFGFGISPEAMCLLFS